MFKSALMKAMLLTSKGLAVKLQTVLFSKLIIGGVNSCLDVNVLQMARRWFFKIQGRKMLLTEQYMSMTSTLTRSESFGNARR